MQLDGIANMSLTHGAVNVHDVYPCAWYSPHPASTATSTTSPNHDSATTSNDDDGHHHHLLLHFVLPAISTMAVATTTPLPATMKSVAAVFYSSL